MKTSILFTQSDIIEMMVEKGNPFGGAVVEAFVWIKALNEIGVNTMVFRTANDKRAILNEFKSIKTLQTYDPNIGIKWIRWFTHRFPVMISAIKKSNADFIYEPIPTWNSFFLGLIYKFFGIKQILRIANDNMLDERIKITHSKFDQLFIQLGFKICDFISVQNEFQYITLKKKYPSKKIIKLFNPIVIQSDFKNKDYMKTGYIAWVANFRFQKNLQLLYKIAFEFSNEKFKVAGKPIIPMDNETQIHFEKLQNLPNVEFVGSVSRNDILSFFEKSKFLLNTSRYEGFSNTFLEAMMTGTPIITTENVNPDGIIDTFGLGYIYKDENDLKQILNSISETDYLQKSTNCIEYVQKNHDHLVLAQKLLHFLKE
jgi:glycosyltransferase involved in cell wall biosynthesis